MTLFDAYHDAAEKLCTDPQVAEALEKESFGKKNEVYRSLYGATAACREMAGFHLYNVDGSCLYSTGNRYLRTDAAGILGDPERGSCPPE